MTTLTTVQPRRLARRIVLITATPSDSRRGRLNAAAFGAMVFFGLAFAMALVLPGPALLLGEAAAFVLATFAAGRLMQAQDTRGWLRAAAWVVGAVLIAAVAIGAIFAFLAWGPLAP
jgi:hypothetical protein